MDNLPAPFALSSSEQAKRRPTVRVPQHCFLKVAARFPGLKGNQIAKLLIESAASEVGPWVNAIRHFRDESRRGTPREQFTLRPDSLHLLKIEMVVAEFSRRFSDERVPSIADVIGGLYLLHAQEQESAPASAESSPVQAEAADAQAVSLNQNLEFDATPLVVMPPVSNYPSQDEKWSMPTSRINKPGLFRTQKACILMLVILEVAAYLILYFWMVNRVAIADKKAVELGELYEESERARTSERLRYEREAKIIDLALEKQWRQMQEQQVEIQRWQALAQSQQTEIQRLKNQPDSAGRKAPSYR